MDIEDMMDALIRKASNSQDNDMTDEEMANSLREIAALRSDVQTFLPGQVIVHKYPKFANTVNAERPAVFVGYTDPFVGHELPGAHPEQLGSFKMALYQDCIIMKFAGDKVIEFLEDSKDYKLHPDFILKN